ncbi:hypothetical protein MHYP_G00365800 [Metynnis hypsauchen]
MCSSRWLDRRCRSLLDQHEGFPAQPRGRQLPLPGIDMAQGPRSTPGFLGSVPRTVRFQWRNTEAGDAFPDRVPFIREVLFGALGLAPQDLVCAQRNNAARFFDVAMSSEEGYQRVLERGVDVSDHPLGQKFDLYPLGHNGRRMVTVHLFNPFVTAEAIRTFLRRYGEVQPGETMVRDELGIWNGRRQFMVEFREDGKGGLTHPPAYFSLNGNKGYLFYRGQPAFCRGCLQHGHEVSGCKDLNCMNCLGQGHQARDCKNPRRCKSCGGEGHMAHSCPRREATYATVLAGAGGGPVVPRTVGEEGQTGTGAQGSNESGAPAVAIVASSPGAAGGPAPGPHPLAGKEAPPISRPVKRARKRRRAQDEEMERRQRAGSPGAAPEGAPISPPVPPKLEDISVLVGDGTPSPPLTYGGREAPPNEAAYLDGLESELTILTTNVRGLQKATKRTAVFRDLASTSASICCLQEVHLRDQRDEALFSQEWRRGKAYWSVGGVHSTGVGILFGDRSFEKVSPFTVVQGRALGVDATWRGQNLRVLCVYAPVDPSSRIAFLEALSPFCITNRHVVVAGDFNINLEGRDDVSTKHFKKLVAGFSLIDGFKFCNPGNPGHTWHNSRGASSRLDYILVAPPVTVRTTSLSPRWYSDHMMVEATVSIDAPSFGRGYWKLNVEILEEIDYQSLFRDHFAAWLGCKSDFASPAAWWEHIKERIRALTIHYCSQRKAAKLQRVRDLEKQLKTSYADYNNGGALDLDRAQALRAELRALHERAAADSLFSARLQMAEENETCSAFFFQRVRKARGKRCFTSLKDSEGRTCSDPAQMMGIAHRFYSNLFSNRGTDREIGEHFLSSLKTSLPSVARDSLETPFSLGELTEVLGKMNRRKVPGLDGLPVEFYSTFWDVLGPEIVEVAEDVHRQGRLTESMRSGVLSLLYKKGDPMDLANWRPLTMLCVDLKIFAKALTERLKKTMSLLVHSDQTCGVPGRSVTWNLHLIRDAISWAGDRNVPLALVSLDQEKAFDRVDHSFLEKVLTTLGFGPNFLRWLKTFYTEVGSRVSINGHLSDLVPQESGVRQGCPLSPLLYALYIEPLAAAIRAHPGIDGLPIPGGGGKVVKLAQYADDTTLFVRSDQSLRHALDVVQAFGRASGAALNPGKSVVKYFGRWTDRKDAAGGLALSDGPLKILGVSFMQVGAARANWEKRLDIARRKMGLWKSRSLSFLGKVLVLKVDILPSLLYLAHVYPMPRDMRRGLTRDVFNLMWGGRYEYVKREVMYLGKDRGGRDVPDIPLKLDCLFFAQHCARLAAPLEHPHQYFVRLWLSWPLRAIVSTWSNSGPKAETLPDHYRHLVRWSKLLPAGLRPEAFVKHKTLYKEVLDGRGHRAVVGLEEDTWSRVQPKGLDNRLQDLNWQCVHGKLPVREVLYRHGLTRHPRCPRPACAKDESLWHVFWECGYARATWGKVDGLCRALDPQFVLTCEKVMRGWSHDTRSPFLSRMWLLVSVTKRELWNARTSLIQKGTILDIVGIYKKICADLRFRMEHDVIRWGYHAAKESTFLSLLDQHEGFPAQPRGRQRTLPGIGMAQGPRSTPGFLGSVPRTVRFQWRNTEAGDAFPDRVPFIREVLFGALGLAPQDLVCAQRNNAARFFDVAMSSEEGYQRVLERGVDVSDHPLGQKFDLHPLGHNGRRMVTVHLFNPFVTAEAIRTFLRRYGEVQPGETMVRDELGIWNGRRQFMVEFREDGKGGLTHPPAYFSLNGNKGYLFYRGQPAFCRGCLQHGHEVSGCKDLNCKNCLGQGHQARDCKNPRRCKSCGGEGHMAHSCPRREATYATVLAGAGGGPVVPRTVGEEGQTGTGAQGSNESGAPAVAIAASSPGVAGGPAPGPHPLAGKEAPPISRPVKRARKRRRAQDEEMERRQRAGSPGAAPEGAPLSPPVPPKLEDTSVLVGDGTPPPPLTYGGREVPPNEAAYLDGLESELTILTTNVRGLQKATKRTAVFRDLASTSASICCLQEVHLRDQRDEALFSQEWRRGKAYWSVGGVHSTGVGILFGDRSFEKVSPFTVVQGRALGVDATWRGQNLRVLCVYAPVDPSSRIAFLEALSPFCTTNRHVVVAGDFNINLEGRDDVSTKHFKKLVAGFSLIDSFKFCNPGNPGHTWHNSRGASSRIDYILVAPPITVRTASSSPRWYSDHMMVEATVSIDAPSFGRGYWKLNVEILEEMDYQSLFRDHFAAWLGCKSDFASPAAWWEHIKERIRALTIHYCSQRKAAKLQRVRDLEKQLKTSYADYNNGGGARSRSCTGS